MAAIALRAASLCLLLVAGQGMARASTSEDAGAMPAARPPATRILAIGRLTPKAKITDIEPILAREVPATLELYLAGKISDWYAMQDQSGVVFLLNVTSTEEARMLLDDLPLGRAGLMTFELTPLGPLRPLGLLLRRPAK